MREGGGGRRGAVRVRVTVRVTVILGGSPPPSCFLQSALFLPSNRFSWQSLGNHAWTDSTDDCSRNSKLEIGKNQTRVSGNKENRGKKKIGKETGIPVSSLTS